jgi:hydroxyethylthiazole kinase-like uncharacterized protein yjeF
VRILTSAEMAAVDRAAQLRGMPSRTLMERAAEGIVEMAREVRPGAGNVVIICGPGSNGGDGLAAARLWRAAGTDVRVVTLDSPDRFRGDARANWEAAISAGVPALGWVKQNSASLSALARSDLIVDALFGTGLSRALSGAARRFVDAANRSGPPILAIDVPSGLSGDSGERLGPAVSARWTGAVAALKRCHVLYPARERCGDIAVIDIGIPDDLIETRRHRFAMIGAGKSPPLPARPTPTRETGRRDHRRQPRKGGSTSLGAGALRAAPDSSQSPRPRRSAFQRLPEATPLAERRRAAAAAPPSPGLERMDAAGASRTRHRPGRRRSWPPHPRARPGRVRCRRPQPQAGPQRVPAPAGADDPDAASGRAGRLLGRSAKSRPTVRRPRQTRRRSRSS